MDTKILEAVNDIGFRRVLLHFPTHLFQNITLPLQLASVFSACSLSVHGLSIKSLGHGSLLSQTLWWIVILNAKLIDMLVSYLRQFQIGMWLSGIPLFMGFISMVLHTKPLNCFAK